MGWSRWIAVAVAGPLLLIPTVGPYLGLAAYVAIMLGGFIRMRRRDKARGM